MKFNKLTQDFFNISLSVTKSNSLHSNEAVKSYLVATSLNNDAIESATGISPDTIQRRINLGTKDNLPWYEHTQDTMLGLVPKIIKCNRRVRWTLVIDESLEPFFGNIDELKDQLKEKDLPNFLSTYRVQRGSTASFHYTMIVLHSKLGTFPVAIIPKVSEDDTFKKIEQVISAVHKAHKEICLLADRGYGNRKVIKLCQKLKVNYCIRLKKTGKLKTIKKNHRNFFWHNFKEVKFRVIMYKSHGRETFFFAVGKKGGSSQWFRLLYKDRWSIENLFKNCDRIQLRTSSRNTLFRLFCFVLSMFLMLLYQLKKLTSHKKRISIRRTLYDIFSIKVLVILKAT